VYFDSIKFRDDMKDLLYVECFDSMNFREYFKTFGTISASIESNSGRSEHDCYYENFYSTIFRFHKKNKLRDP
jgi:hypothetical protein